MNSNSQNPFTDRGASDASSCNAEETLRLIANLPAPAGLEDRLHEVMRSAPRRGRILNWPAKTLMRADWMRAAAAAAIAFVVAGGGWGVYSRVQQAPPANAVAMPPHVAAPGGFSSAGAMRTPPTIEGPVVNGPVVDGPVLVHPVKAHSSQLKRTKKSARTSRQSGNGSRIVAPPVARMQ